MLIFSDWTIKTDGGLIARQYDNLTQELLVTGDLPQGWSWELLVQAGGSVNVIALAPRGEGVGVTLTAEMLTKAGPYTLQLRGGRGEEVRHTNVIQVVVPASLVGDATWPELPSEFSQAEANIRALNAHPPIPGDNGYWLLWDLETEDYVESQLPLPEVSVGPQINDAIITDANPWSSKKIIDTLCPSFEVEGNPVTCTPVEGYPLGVQVSWEPTQEGDGDPSLENVRPISGRESIKVTRCGKNLWNYSLNPGRTMWIIPFIPQGTYTISALSAADWWTGNQNSVDWFLRSVDGTVWLTTVRFTNTVVGQRRHATLTFPYSGSFLLATYSTNTTASMQDLQIEPGSVATDYEPYQGDDYTLTLPKTIYGGTVDIVMGIGIEEWGYIASYNGEALPGEWISDRDVYSPDVMPTIGAEVAYKLSASQPFQTTGGHPIPALSGTNTIYTDGDSMTVSGRADPNAVINNLAQRLAALEGAMLSMMGVQSNV